MKIVFWVSFGILFYTYFGYLLFLFVISKFKKNTHIPNPNFLPPISILIPSHNEEEVIIQKIENCLSLDYPNRLEIIVVSDGSTDRTVELAHKVALQSHEKATIRVLHFTDRRGKIAILNDAVCDARTDILVFTDANAMFKEDALIKLIPHLADPTVGCVGGVKKIVSNGEVSENEKIYWGMETIMKTKEAEIGSTFVDGAIYALKKEVYPFPKDDHIIMDDFAVALGVINKNKRVVFESSAIAYEGASKQSRDEFRRKIRIFMGAINSIRCFSIKKVVPQVISHKIFRWSTFIFMMTLLISNLFIGGAFYSICLLVQVMFYGLAIVGLILNLFHHKQYKLFYAPFYFCLTTIAQVVGFIKYMRKTHPAFWEKLDRGLT
ncbi:MAG: glycosyltransferase family 2 protein [Candidatus Stahlbacteria bacterium]|nr:glycosyltransferase family 2 protein [Candidatus Stahlbacteria bacterium]